MIHTKDAVLVALIKGEHYLSLGRTLPESFCTYTTIRPEMSDKPIPQINIQTVLQSPLDPVAKTHRHHQQPAAEPGSVVGPLVATSSDVASGSGSGPGRMGRIARKPLRLAGSAIRYGLRRGESSTSSSTAAAAGALGEPEAVVVARGRRKPLDGEKEVAVLRVRVVGCEGLVVRDRSGSSDP